MMRMKFELLTVLIHVHVYPACHAFAVWPLLLTLAIAVLNTLVPLWLARNTCPHGR